MGIARKKWRGLVEDSIIQRVHVGIWYILRAQKCSHIPTLRSKYIPYTYMDPLGKDHLEALKSAVSVGSECRGYTCLALHIFGCRI